MGMPPPGAKRDDRDHRKPYTPAKGTETPQRSAIPVEVDEETSANYTGPDLQAFREQQQTPDRVSRLEVKHDRLAAIVGETREDVREMRGEMKALPRLVDLIEKMASGAHVALTAQVKVDAAEKLEEIDERKAKREERIERWKFAGKVAAVVGVGLELLHRTGVL